MNLLPLFATCFARTLITTVVDDFSKFQDDDEFAAECYRLAGRKVKKKHRKNEW